MEFTQELELRLALKNYLYQKNDRKEIVPVLEQLFTIKTYLRLVRKN